MAEKQIVINFDEIEVITLLKIVEQSVFKGEQSEKVTDLKHKLKEGLEFDQNRSNDTY